MARGPRPVPTEADLLRASKHLNYEIFMLRETAIRLAAEQPYVERCALLESFTIHARSLDDFLWHPVPPKDNDVLAEHYFPGGTWNTKPTRPAALEELRKKVGATIAHLSYDRPPAGQEHHWDYVALGGALDAAIHALREDAERAAPGKLPPRFATGIVDLGRVSPPLRGVPTTPSIDWTRPRIGNASTASSTSASTMLGSDFVDDDDSTR
jgi:hypothetical protein